MRENGNTWFEIADQSYIVGKVDEDNVLHVSGIHATGEGSGTAIDWIIEPALKESKGEFVVSCIWEGGESINQLSVKNGVIEWKDIEI